MMLTRRVAQKSSDGATSLLLKLGACNIAHRPDGNATELSASSQGSPVNNSSQGYINGAEMHFEKTK